MNFLSFPIPLVSFLIPDLASRHQYILLLHFALYRDHPPGFQHLQEATHL